MGCQMQELLVDGKCDLGGSLVDLQMVMELVNLVVVHQYNLRMLLN
jgi:hypothetical protein